LNFKECLHDGNLRGFAFLFRWLVKPFLSSNFNRVDLIMFKYSEFVGKVLKTQAYVALGVTFAE